MTASENAGDGEEMDPELAALLAELNALDEFAVKPTDLPEPLTLPYDGDETLAALIGEPGERVWESDRRVLAANSGNQLTRLIDGLVDHSSVGEWIPVVLERSPEDSIALTVLGADTVARAWRIRGDAPSRAQLPEDRLEEFERLLNEAEELLYRSARIEAKCPAPWYYLQSTGRGLELRDAFQRRRFDAVTRRYPGHLGAYEQLLLRRRSTYWEEMVRLAWKAACGEYGGTLGVLMPWVHHLNRTVSDADYQAEMRPALVSAAQRTIFRPGFGPQHELYRSACMFAWAFCDLGMWVDARRAFLATHGVVVNWNGSADPVGEYTRLRELAFHP